MENFIVSARKYRPKRFADLKGQEHVTATLCNAIKNDQVARAFLFCGLRGSGKTTSARLLAKAINCLQTTDEGEPCNGCKHCIQRTSLNIHELDAASHNSAEGMRQIVEQIRYRPAQGFKTVIIIDEAHGLSNAALNVLLKPLEDTPDHVVFILVTTEKHKIIPTILSRCQLFDFRPIDVPQITTQLASIARQEKISYEEEALTLIGQKALGSMRDALSIFDLIVTFSGRKDLTYAATMQHLNLVEEEVYFTLTDALYQADIGQALLCYDAVLAKGIDSHPFIIGFAQHLRNLLVAQATTTMSLIQVRVSLQQAYQTKAKTLPAAFIYQVLSLIQACDMHYKTSANRRLHVEMMLIKVGQINLAQANPTTKPQAISRKVQPVPAKVKQHPSSPLQPPSQPKPLEAKPYVFTPARAMGMVAERQDVAKPKVVKGVQEAVAGVAKPIDPKSLLPSGSLPIPPTTLVKKKTKKPYTDREKLADLAQTHPDVRYLTSRLELETI